MLDGKHGSASRAIDAFLCTAGNIFVNLGALAGLVLIVALIWKMLVEA